MDIQRKVEEPTSNIHPQKKATEIYHQKVPETHCQTEERDALNKLGKCFLLQPSTSCRENLGSRFETQKILTTVQYSILVISCTFEKNEINNQY